MTPCLLCRQTACSLLLDLGLQPVCHHFFDGNQDEDRHPLRLGQCEDCGLVQLLNPVPAGQLVPHFDWIANREPEGHLDALVDVLRALPGISAASKVHGASHKDASTLQRLREQGFAAASTEPSDLLIARHILEHAANPRVFVEGLAAQVSPAGYVVFEVPDCRGPLRLLDYTMLWEEHTLYLDEDALRICLARGGLVVERILSYAAPYETALVAIARPAGAAEPLPPHNSASAQRQRPLAFARALGERRLALRDLLSRWRRTGAIALFGAGHHAVTFLNVMGVADLIDCVIDDHPRKQGLRTPGSRLPIVGAEVLKGSHIKLCLSGLGFDSERRVLQAHRRFVDQGGTFASIFPTNRASALTHLAGPGLPP